MKTIALIALLYGSASAQPYRSVTANNAVTTFEKSMRKARAKYASDVAEAKKKLISALTLTLRATTKAGDLKEANRIDAAIKRLKSDAEIVGKPKQPQSMVGTWQVRASGRSAARVYQINADGTVLLKIENDARLYRGKVTTRAGERFIGLRDNDTNRISVVGDRVFIEHWRGAMKGFPHTLESGFRGTK